MAIDAEITNLKTGASGSTVRHVWNTRETPADIRVGAFDDPGAEPHITPPPANGTRFAVIVLEGEIDMDIDDETVHMKAGDVMIQRGTNHAWCNRGDATGR